MENKRTAFGLLDETDNRLMEIESCVRLMAMAAPDCGDWHVWENVMLHLADNLRSVRATVEEATGAVIREKAPAA